MSYLDERFGAAVSILVGEGSVKYRLLTAYLEHLDDLESDELPQELWKKFEDLDATLHTVTPIGREPCVRATIRKISKLQAGNHARTIISLYVDLVRRSERAGPLRATNLTYPSYPTKKKSHPITHINKA